MGKYTYLLAFSFLMAINGYSRMPMKEDTLGLQPTSIEQMDEKVLTRMDEKYSDLTKSLDGKSMKFLDKMEKKEIRMRDQLMLKDSMAAKKLFADAQSKYETLKNKLQSPVTAIIPRPLQEYIPRLDSLQTFMHFLSQPTGGGAGIPSGRLQQLQALSSQLQQLQGKWQQAGEVQDFARQREQELTDQLGKYNMNSQLLGINKEIYYYKQGLANYKEILSAPDKISQTALGIAQKLPFFQSFMQKNSYLGQLFPMPQNYGTPQALAGVPSSADVGNMIAQKMGSAGNKIDPQQYLEQQAQSGQDQLSSLKDKVSKTGGSNSDMEIPRFTPNNQKTKSFLHRLEFGFNIQNQSSTTTLPTTSALAVTIGYKISEGAVAGVGVSYQLGLGNGINHIALSNQGAGLRSFLDIKAKGSIWVTGGLEYNYMQEFAKWADIRNINVWQKSALLGLSKKYKIGKQAGNLQLLYDFLARYQMPVAPSIKFRIGYTF